MTSNFVELAHKLIRYVTEHISSLRNNQPYTGAISAKENLARYRLVAWIQYYPTAGPNLVRTSVGERRTNSRELVSRLFDAGSHARA